MCRSFAFCPVSFFSKPYLIGSLGKQLNLGNAVFVDFIKQNGKPNMVCSVVSALSISRALPTAAARLGFTYTERKKVRK